MACKCLSSGGRGEGQGQSKQDPRHWCLHTCWFKCRTNRFPPRPLLLYFQLRLPHNITFTFTAAVTYKQLFSRLGNSFLKFLPCATFRVFTVMLIKIQVFYYVAPRLLLIFIDVSATGLYLFILIYQSARRNIPIHSNILSDVRVHGEVSVHQQVCTLCLEPFSIWDW